MNVAALSKLRPILLAGVVALILIQVLLLSPAPLEQSSGQKNISPDLLLEESASQAKLAKGIPLDRIPDYTIDQFDYAATKNGQRQWRLHAEKAFFFTKENLVHSVKIKALLYDSNGEVTEVTGNEAKYVVHTKVLEIFGNVKSRLPDGFETNSQYLWYLPHERVIRIPDTEPVSGNSTEEKGPKISFTSLGLFYKLSEGLIILNKQVKFISTRMATNKKTGVEEKQDTVIDADSSRIHRREQYAGFTMFESRPLDEQFVQVHETALFSRSRRVTLNYGKSDKPITYMIAHDDVLIKEKEGTSLRYSTSGQADFDNIKNVVILTKFPQVYQDDDTVTGDIVILHRDSDIVEVEHSNAFSTGPKGTPSPLPNAPGG